MQLERTLDGISGGSERTTQLYIKKPTFAEPEILFEIKGFDLLLALGTSVKQLSQFDSVYFQLAVNF